MARIAGINIPTNKRVLISLTYIHGIGRTKAKDICTKVGIPDERRVAELTDQEVFSQVPEVVLTHGEKGVGIFTREGICHVDAVPDVNIVEVTGCGDAFRAGYAYGILNNFDLEERGQIGCIMAARNLENPETQRYRINVGELKTLRATIYD